MSKFKGALWLGGAIVLGVGLSTSASAFGLGGIGAVAHAIGAGSGPSSTTAVNAQSKLVEDYAICQTEIIKAQALFAQAFGLRNQAAVLRADARALHHGASENDLSKAMGDSSRTTNAIDHKMQQGEKLSAKGNRLYMQGLVPYGFGVNQTVAMGSDFTRFARQSGSAIRSASLADKLSLKNKLATGIFISAHAPSYIDHLGKATWEMVSYNKRQGIVTPKNLMNAMTVLRAR